MKPRLCGLIAGLVFALAARSHAAPGNDNFASAAVLSGTTFIISGSTVGATSESGEPFSFYSSFNQTHRTVWWVWTAPTNGTVVVDTIGSSYDTMLTIYTGYFLSSLTHLADDDDSGGSGTSRTTFTAFAGFQYYIQVDGWSGASGSITLHMVESPAATPPNDQFANAAIYPFQDYSYPVGYNDSATKENGEPNHADNPGGHSVWWNWTAPNYGDVHMDTEGSTFDTLLAVYTGTSVSNLVPVASDDDDGGNLTSQVNFPGVPGTTYRIAVDGYNGAHGFINLRVSQLEVAPPNDLFAKRFVFPATTNSVTGNNSGANTEPGDPMGGTSIWWTWTAPSNCYVILDTSGSRCDTALGVYTGSVISNLTQIAYGYDSSGVGMTQIAFPAVGGTSYQIAVHGQYGPYWYVSEGPIELNLNQFPLPVNDMFTNRTTITGSSNTVYGVNTFATLEAGEPNHNPCYSASNSLWWTWTAPFDGTAIMDVNASSYGAIMSVYTGNTLSNLVRVATNLACGYTTLVFPAKAGTNYQIAVAALPFDTGNIVLNVQEGVPPLNDAFTNRILITGFTNSVLGNNRFATLETGEPADGNKSVWWTWTAPSNGVVRLDTIGSPIDTICSVYTGLSLSNLNLIAYGYGYAGATNGGLTFSCQAGSNYQFAVDPSSANGGDFMLNLYPVAPPSNDNFTNRFPIQNVTVFQGSVLGATLETNEPVHSGRQRSIWWSWTAPGSGPVTLLDNGSQVCDMWVDVYSGNTIGTLTNLGSWTYGYYSPLQFTATAGMQYQIAVSAFSYTDPECAGSVGDVKLALKLFNWGFSNLTTTVDYISYTTSFSANFWIANLGYDSPTARIRLVAVPGYSATQSYPVYSLPAPQDLGVFPAGPVSLTPSFATNFPASGVCPAPNPLNDQNFAVGWGVYAVLEEMFGTNWIVVDSKNVLTGYWPSVAGFNGPGGGVVRIDPSLSGTTFNPITLSSVSVNGPTTVPEGSSASYYATASFNYGPAQNFTNGGWASSLPSIASITTNGILSVGNISSNTTISLSLPYSYNGTIYTASTNVTGLNLPPPTIGNLTLIPNGTLSLTLSGVPGRKHVIEATTNMGSSAIWIPVVTNVPAANGLTNWIDPARTNFVRRFYRVREAE